MLDEICLIHTPTCKSYCNSILAHKFEDELTTSVGLNVIQDLILRLKVQCSIHSLSFCTWFRGTMRNTSGIHSNQEQHLELLPAQEHSVVCRTLSPGEAMQTSERFRLGKQL